MNGTENQREDFYEEIRPDLTPMIDCVFLLLIFFMVSTVLIQSGMLIVRLPEAAHPVLVEHKTITVVLAADGRISVENRIVPTEGVRHALENERITARTASVILRADADAPHGVVLDVMAAARDAGIERVDFATRKGRP